MDLTEEDQKLINVLNNLNSRVKRPRQPSHNEQVRKLDADTEVFLASGGKIDVMPITERAQKRAHSNSIWKLTKARQK